MIQIYTHLNSFKTDEGKDKYCFRSVVDQTIDSEELIRQIVNYNSTLTEADVRAMLTVLNEKVRKLVNLGYKVELPFGYVFNTAKGTAARINDGFVPGKGNHCIIPEFRFKKDAVKDMAKDAVFKNAGKGYAIRPVITELYSIKSDATISRELSFEPGAILHISGRNLKFDPNDNLQGVFLVDSENHKIRVESYSRIGRKIVECRIPALNPGNYEVKLVTKPGITRYETYSFSKTVLVTAWN